MNISLRSQMTAGVAALSAAVVAVAPITQPDLLPSAERIAAAIQLSAFSNPVIAITDNIFFATGYFLDQDFVSDNIVRPRVNVVPEQRPAQRWHHPGPGQPVLHRGAERTDQ